MMLDKDILKIAINRCKVIPVSNGDTNKVVKLAFMADLTNLGYQVTNSELFNDSVMGNFDTIIDTLTSMKGGDVDYVPLFNGFPNEVPQKDDFFLKRMIGFRANVMGLFTEGTKMDDGMIIPNWLFDLDEFSGNPITGKQSSESYLDGVSNQFTRLSDSNVEWTNLEFVSLEEMDNKVRKFLANNLYAKSSIKESLKEDIEFLMNYYGLDFLDGSKVVFKETKSYIMTKLWNDGKYETLKGFINTPTDILRMFAGLTSTDISLATNIKFPKLKRAQRRFILETLDKFSNLAENLNTYKGLWVELGRYLHPGEYRNRYSNVFKAFTLLRNGKVVTFNGKVEKAIESKDLDTTLSLLASRPGQFGRKLHELLVNFFTDTDKILSKFGEVANQIELKNLLVLETYFKTIDSSEYRSVINKKGKVIVLPNKKAFKLNDSVDKVVEVIQTTIKDKLASEKEDMSDKKVWVDPQLMNYTVPLQQRKMSDGLLSIGRGTRIKFDDKKVLRMFTYWKDSHTDLDLSMIQFDKDMNFLGQVSYTNLSDDGIVHSGDLTSAPNGAAEFIDVDLNKVKDGVRYIGVQIYRYSGENFANLEKSYAGWMFREDVNNDYKSFDIKTVANKFNVVGSGNYAIPLVVDLKTKEIIYIDMYMSGRNNSYNSNEGAINDISIVTKELVKMIETRPNMFDLVNYHIEASKAEIVNDKSEAELTYGIKDCDFNVTNVEDILAEML